MRTTTPRSFETRAFAAADARSPLAAVGALDKKLRK